jgi:hypothetical protein
MQHLIAFKEKLLKAFQSSNKTSWGKTEVVNRILTEYILFLEGIRLEMDKASKEGE